jgi:hypothetical protein
MKSEHVPSGVGGLDELLGAGHTDHQKIAIVPVPIISTDR